MFAVHCVPKSQTLFEQWAADIFRSVVAVNVCMVDQTAHLVSAVNDA